MDNFRDNPSYGLQPRIGISSSKNISPSKGLGTGGITPNKSPRVKGYRISVIGVQ